MSFINDNFMLHNKTGKKLYKAVKDVPIIDFHCHLQPRLIAEDYNFKNAFELFLSEDHYKWRLLRSFGIDEEFVTGNGDEYTKWEGFAKAVPYMMGNPMYHWIHLELKRYFGIDEELNEKTAKKIWDKINTCLPKEDFSVRNLIRRSNVEVICTSDDPYDDLRYHKQLKEENFEVKVLPSFRPDMNNIKSDIVERMDFFNENGCVLSDHSVNDMTDETIEKLIFLGEEYAKRGWVMQLHIGPIRNNNSRMFEKFGPDGGFDSMNDFRIAEGLAKLLDSLERKDMLPKTILYCLNPKDNYVIGTMMGNFQKGPGAGKLQFGSGWWYNDQRDGMEAQMKALANLGIFSKFVGMLTDSRSFVSYSRHEYFRRILCNLVGEWVENGEYPDNQMVEKIVKAICYDNAKEYFGF